MVVLADHARLMSTARTNLLLRYPFFGTLALYMRLIPERGVRTAATDGKDIYYDPAFVSSLASPQGIDLLQTVIAHEVLHAALGHVYRRADREPDRWNVAADLVVNMLLDEAGLSLPAGALLDRSFAGLNAETVYSRLPKTPLSVGALAGRRNQTADSTTQAGRPVPGLLDDHSKWSLAGASASSQLAAEWRQRVTQAAQLAARRGRLPASLSRMVEELLYPRLDWRQALAIYVRPAQGDYTFLPPDRRFLDMDLYLPSFEAEGLEDVVVAIDTSGSVWDICHEFLRELYGIVSSYPQFRGYVALCDATVHLFEELTPDTTLRRLQGGGGTDFRPLFKEIEKRGLQPTVVIFLTDGDAYIPTVRPPYPVLWVLPDPSCTRPPWGAVSYLDLKGVMA